MEGLTQIICHLVGVPQILHAEADDIHKVLHQPKELLGIGAHLRWREVGKLKPRKMLVPRLLFPTSPLLCYLFCWALWVIPLHSKVAGSWLLSAHLYFMHKIREAAEHTTGDPKLEQGKVFQMFFPCEDYCPGVSVKAGLWSVGIKRAGWGRLIIPCPTRDTPSDLNIVPVLLVFPPGKSHCVLLLGETNPTRLKVVQSTGSRAETHSEDPARPHHGWPGV